MGKQNFKLSIVVMVSTIFYMGATHAIGTDAVMTDEMKLQEPSQEAIDACAGKSEGNSCEYTKTGTKVAGVCQKNASVTNDTNKLICQ